MKRIHVILGCLLSFISLSLHAQTEKKDSVKVWGNCSSCKKHIEKAALAGGADFASWNMSTKMLLISYNPAKVSDTTIQKAVAAAGYDTQQYTGNDKAYAELDPCCQYDRKSSSSNK